MKAKTALEGAVTINSDILGGTPVFTGTRVPVENLFEFLEAGDSLETFFRAFPRVKPEHAKRVLSESSSGIIAIIGERAA